MGRWDFLADQKPVALRDKVLDLVADELVREVRHWPPQPLEWEDPKLEQRFAPVLARTSNPELDTLRVACELSRLDLLREYEPIDTFWKSPQRAQLLPTHLEEETAQFLIRWLVEGALEFQEAVQGRFKRTDLAKLIERVEDRLVRGFRLRLDAPSETRDA
jgi:hypothetical protein